MTKFYLSIIVVLSCFTSCSNVEFKKAQPKGIKTLSSFPVELQGTYVAEKGHELDTLIIRNDKYLQGGKRSGKLSNQELENDSSIYIKNGLLYGENLSISNGVPFTIENDTIFYDYSHYNSMDLSKALVIKPFNNYHVLSKQEENKTWEVLLIEQKGEELIIYTEGNFYGDGKIDKKLEYDGALEDFFKITKFKKIKKGKYRINPSPEEFEMLVEAQFFRPYIVYKKIKI